MVKIGITTSVFDTGRWYRDISSSSIKTIEIRARTAVVLFDEGWLEKVKPNLKGFDMSMHSGTFKLFSANEQFVKTDLEVIRSEILVCNILGIKELIFHLKHEKLEKDEAEKLREIVDFAKSKDVEMLYEMNGKSSADVILDFLERFPDVNFNLDLGHLNLALGKGMLGCELDVFLEKIKDRVVYIHAHNNNGQKDQHIALREGILDWKHVLDMLDMTKVKKIISESRLKEDVEKDLVDLGGFFDKN